MGGFQAICLGTPPLVVIGSVPRSRLLESDSLVILKLLLQRMERHLVAKEPRAIDRIRPMKQASFAWLSSRIANQQVGGAAVGRKYDPHVRLAFAILTMCFHLLLLLEGKG